METIMKMTVKEYAKRFEISTQATYQQIAKGNLQTVVENNKKYIIVNDKTKQTTLQDVANPLANDLQSYWQESLQKKELQLSLKDDEIKRLNEELMKAKDEITKAKEHENSILLRYIEEVKQFKLEHKSSEDIKIEPVPEEAEEAEIEEDVVFTKEEEQELKRLKKKRKKKKLFKEEKVAYKTLKAKQKKRDHGV